MFDWEVDFDGASPIVIISDEAAVPSESRRSRTEAQFQAEKQRLPMLL